MPSYIAQSGDLDRCYRYLTDSLTTLRDRAPQLLIKFKSGALVMQFDTNNMCYTCSFIGLGGFQESWCKSDDGFP